MHCQNPKLVPHEDLPVGFTGSTLNIQVAPDGRVWVCIDGQSVLRCRGLSKVTLDDPHSVVKPLET